MSKPHCCIIECDKNAEYGIYGGSRHFEDVTEACEDHVGALLGTPDWLKQNNTEWTVVELSTEPVVLEIENYFPPGAKQVTT